MDLADLTPRAVRRLPPGWLLALAGLLSSCAYRRAAIPLRDPLSAAEHAQLGAAYAARGAREQARLQYQASVRAEPARVEPWIALGNLAFEEGDLRSAERSYRRALRLHPRHPGASNNLAAVLLARDEDPAKAEALADDALWQGGPLRPYVLDTLAHVYLRQGRYPAAREACRLSAAAAPAGDAAFEEQIHKTQALIDAALTQAE